LFATRFPALQRRIAPKFESFKLPSEVRGFFGGKAFDFAVSFNKRLFDTPKSL
jgi:hypothetical protein